MAVYETYRDITGTPVSSTEPDGIVVFDYPYVEPVTPQEMVREFHETFGAVINDLPTRLSVKDRALRISLIMEEAKEAVEALLAGSREEPEYLAEVAKELSDILYVVYGTGVAMGLDLDLAFEEVHRSNMSKVWEDGTVKYREDGKVLKPPTYSPADIRGVLDLG